MKQTNTSAAEQPKMTKNEIKCSDEPTDAGLPIRSDLRAGLAWDDLDDQAVAFWGSLKSAFSGLTSGS